MTAVPIRVSRGALLTTLLALAAPSLSAAEDALLRINCGSKSDFTDDDGNVWLADLHYVGGSRSSVPDPIADTSDDGLYQSERYGNPFSYQIPVPDGSYEVVLHHCEQYFSEDDKRVFDVTAEGGLVVDDLDIHATVGELTAFQNTVVAEVTDGVLDLSFAASKNNGQICGLEVYPHTGGHPYLHVVIVGPDRSVDHEDNGYATMRFLGEDSHTHEFGHAIVGYTWELDGQVVGTTANLDLDVPLGIHELSLTIADDNVPAETLTRTITVRIDPEDRVQGALTRTFDRNKIAGGPMYVNRYPEYVEVLERLRIDAIGPNIGNSDLENDTWIRFKTRLELPNPGVYEFTAIGGSRSRLSVDGMRIRGPVNLAAGVHDLRWGLLVDNILQLPAELLISENGGPAVSIDPAMLHHDQSDLRPFINPIRSSGSTFGGESMRITGVGFFPSQQVQLSFGNRTLFTPLITVSPSEILLTTPPGEGTVRVRVATPNGRSNARRFTYEMEVPVDFDTDIVSTMNDPGPLLWGPDHRLYVASILGQIRIFDFDDDYNVIDSLYTAVIKDLPNPNILSIAFDPTAAPGDPVRLYVAHCALYDNGGSCFDGSSWYSGQISVLEGPNFDTVIPLVTGLPVSNHDHGLNNGIFDEFGDLYISSGSNTNAGIPDCDSGGLPESPLSAGMILLPLSDPAFDGAVSYVETIGGAPNDDQVFGEIVDVAPGATVSSYSSGIRNAFTTVFTTRGEIFAWDNGPNSGFGPKSTGPDSQEPDPNAPDEFLRVIEDAYYGSPNRNRARTDQRQFYYRSPNDAPQDGVYTAPWFTSGSSYVGLIEYRATTFGGRLEGALLSQKWNSKTTALHLNGVRRGVSEVDDIDLGLAGLSLAQGPGGVLFSSDYSDDRIVIARPVDQAAIGLTLYDIFPWRAPASGGTPFVLGGANFPDLANLEVTIGGTPATIDSASPTRIRGFIPAPITPSAELLDVVVRNLATNDESVIEDAFRYLLLPLEGRGSWTTLCPQLPAGQGATSSASLGGTLYVVGDGDASTYTFDMGAGSCTCGQGHSCWTTIAPARPFPGAAHASVTHDHRWYLLGGIGGGAEGQVQIYDPFTASWTQGTPAPFAVGAASAAVIDGKIYLAGGVLPASGTTSDGVAVYDPETDAWTVLSSMPEGRNHAFTGTDGERLWVFGGRDGDGSLSLGFDTVQVYDPVSNLWEASNDGFSTLAPMPRTGSGGGRAVYFRGEFLLFGGATTNPMIAKGVESRVDAYHPETNTWRLEATLPTPRFGADPVLSDRRIWVIGGADDVAAPQGTGVAHFGR